MSKKEKVEIDKSTVTIEYRNVKTGDIVYDKNTKSYYKASIWDVDEAKWVIKSKNKEKCQKSA